MKPVNDGVRLERVADAVKNARDSGCSAIALARVAKEMLGEACSPIAFRYVLQTGLGISFRAAQEASLWSGLEDGPHAISDEALEAVLAPWVSAAQCGFSGSCGVRLLPPDVREGNPDGI